MEALTAQFEESARAAQAQVDGLGASRSELEAAVTRAEVALENADAAVKERGAALAQASEVAAAAGAGLAGRQQAQQSSSETLAQVTGARVALAAAIDVDLKAIAEGEEGAEQGAARFQAIQPILGDMVVDDSLLVALPSICAKPASERMRFDNLATEELGRAMQAKAGELDQQVKHQSSKLATRAAETEAAQAELTTAEGACSVAEGVLSAAQGGHQAAEAVLESARAALDDHEPSCQSAKEAQEVRELDLQNHKAYTLSVFELLRDRTSAKQEPAPECKEAAVEPEEANTQGSVAAVEAEEAMAPDGAREPKDAAQLESKVQEASFPRVTELCMSVGGA